MISKLYYIKEFVLNVVNKMTLLRENTNPYSTYSMLLDEYIFKPIYLKNIGT